MPELRPEGPEHPECILRADCALGPEPRSLIYTEPRPSRSPGSKGRSCSVWPKTGTLPVWAWGSGEGSGRAVDTPRLRARVRSAHASEGHGTWAPRQRGMKLKQQGVPAGWPEPARSAPKSASRQPRKVDLDKETWRGKKKKKPSRRAKQGIH